MQYRRAQVPGGTYFFTLVTNQRQPLLLKPVIYQRLRHAMITIKTRHEFVLSGWCVLPDHIHCIWTLPKNDQDFSKRWRLIKHYVAIGVGIPSNIWQKRYWEHCIKNEHDLQKHMDYLHYNPVKHGYVENAIDWQYSSFKAYVDKGIYTKDWGSKACNEICCGEP